MLFICTQGILPYINIYIKMEWDLLHKLFLLALMATLINAQQTPETVIEEAKRLFAEGNFEEAGEVFLEGKELFPDSVELIYHYA